MYLIDIEGNCKVAQAARPRLHVEVNGGWMCLVASAETYPTWTRLTAICDREDFAEIVNDDLVVDAIAAKMRSMLAAGRLKRRQKIALEAKQQFDTALRELEAADAALAEEEKLK